MGRGEVTMGTESSSQWRSMGFVWLGQMKIDGGGTLGREKSCSNERTALAQEEVGMKQPWNNSDWKARKPSKQWSLRAAFLQPGEWGNLIAEPRDVILSIICMLWGTHAHMHLSCGSGHGPCKMGSWSHVLGKHEAGGTALWLDYIIQLIGRSSYACLRLIWTQIKLFDL